MAKMGLKAGILGLCLVLSGAAPAQGIAPRDSSPSSGPSTVLPDVEGKISVRAPKKSNDPSRGFLGKPRESSPDLLGSSSLAGEGGGGGLEDGYRALSVNPDTYVIDSGDVIQISVLGDVVDQINSQVTPEGQLIIPRIGVFDASGKTFTALKSEIYERLKRLFKNLSYSVSLLKPRTFRIFVLGEVNSPMSVAASAITPLSEIIQSAGGLKPSASRQKITIKRKGESREYDLQKFMREGDLSQNPMVLEGDVVFVPLRGEAVYIGGGVEYPGTYELRADMKSLEDLITAAKPMKTRVAPSAVVKLQRKDDHGEEMITELKMSDLPTRARSVELQGSDIIQYPFGNIGLAPTEADKVYVNGEVRVPGAYAYSSHLTMQDYIGLSGGLTNRANFAQAQIVKKNGVSYSLNEQVRLEPGDTLYVPEVTFKFWQDHIAIIGTLLGIFATTISITQLSK